jgi:hypothetical protein
MIHRPYVYVLLFKEAPYLSDLLVLGNSGKPVTLEMSRLMKFVMQVFRGKELTKIWSLELTKSRSRECAVDWSLEPSKSRSHESAMARNLEPAKPWSREFVKTQSHEPAKPRTSGICEIRGYDGGWGFLEREHSRSSKKQSQSCRLKKSGFNVWTSGRLVNIWDVKDICVCSH